MIEPLSTKYRPKHFSEVTGQVRVTALLQAMVVSQRVPPALIFSGASGSGKTSSARIFAAALNCTNSDEGEPCNSCDGCKFTGTTIIEVDGASAGGVDEIRKLQEVVNYSHAGKWRVVILDECHSMSKDAFNALLKILEEPPANTTFILLTTEVYKIPLTVANRSWDMEFRKIGLADVFNRVKHVAEIEKIPGNDELWREIAKLSDGGLRKSLMFLDQARTVGAGTADEFRALFGSHDSGQNMLESIVSGENVFEEAAKAAELKGSLSALIEEVSKVLCDVLLLSCGATLDLPDTDVVRRRNLLQQIEVQRIPVVFNLIIGVESTFGKETDVVKSAQIFASLVQRALKPVVETPKTPIMKEKETPRPATAEALRALAARRR